MLHPQVKKRNAYRVLFEQKPLERPRHRWESIKMAHNRIKWDGMD
jgi:hypothetical protein